MDETTSLGLVEAGRRPLLYLAGPYTHPDPVANTHWVVAVANVVYEKTAWVPVVPHLSMLWHAITPRPVEFWYEYDLHLLERCDAIIRLPGASTGADKEIAHADSVGVKRVYVDEMPPEVTDVMLMHDA